MALNHHTTLVDYTIEQQSKMSNSRVNEIDLLRFLAAFFVVIFHFSFRGYAADDMTVMPYPLLAPFAKYGYLGVELFFMISGFVILMTAINGGLREFVVSRIVRLYPAFWACCTITFAVMLAIGAPRFSASFGQYIINMTMMNGFIGVPSIDGVYWSLFVELKFYALIGFLLITGNISQAQRFFILWLIASIALEIIPIKILRTLLIADYSAFFIAGGSFYLIWSEGFSVARFTLIVASWGLAIFQSINGLSGFEAYYKTNMSGYVVFGIITTFYLGMLLVSLRRTGIFGQKRWLLAGALTYPLYLLHQNIGFMIFNIAYPVVNPHVIFLSVIILTLGAAFVVHTLIERRFSMPLRNAVNRLADNMQRLSKRSSETSGVRGD